MQDFTIYLKTGHLKGFAERLASYTRTNVYDCDIPGGLMESFYSLPSATPDLLYVDRIAGGWLRAMHNALLPNPGLVEFLSTAFCSPAALVSLPPDGKVHFSYYNRGKCLRSLEYSPISGTIQQRGKAFAFEKEYFRGNDPLAGPFNYPPVDDWLCPTFIEACLHEIGIDNSSSGTRECYTLAKCASMATATLLSRTLARLEQTHLL